MKFICGFLFLALSAGGIAGWRHAGTSASQQPSATPTPQPRAAEPSAQAANQEINNRFVKQISDLIAGHENEPAAQVFKNVQQLKAVPARRLLLIMNLGYSRALGVNCTHCHIEQDFASDDKRPKRAAREMAAMHRMINEQLSKMQNLEPKPNRAITAQHVTAAPSIPWLLSAENLTVMALPIADWREVAAPRHSALEI